MAPEQATSRAADGPSQEEVRQRISALYDQAETATGNYNATRATSTGTWGRVNPAADNGRRRTDPAVDDVTRQWFDVARTRLGPTVPARLPADRMPARPAERPQNGPTDRGRQAAGRPVPELTAGPVPELTAGPVPELTAGPAAARAAGPVAELTARAVPALPAAPETRQEVTKALPAPAIEPRQPSLKTSKEQIQQKLAKARDLLTRHIAAQRSTPIAAIASRPAEDAWPTSEAWAGRQATEEWQTPQSAALGTDTSLAGGMLLDTSMPFGADSAPDSEYGRKAARALAFAREQIGRPCVWGATGPGSYDCSSLTQAAWKTAGVALPRTAYEQAVTGTAIPFASIRPGDLIFFYGDVSHVGLYIGDGMMIHAPSQGGYLREESIFFAGESAIHGAARPA
ncbi:MULTISPECIES: NlpC/P60 family protein [unclassified Streptomyces]|uniref:C40 family peptidase n=1 Tax=unclassified Streptomyces TaxID=2593676 RepID=UPI002E8130D3|nr:NlpC/P60 family protein [Streptomyces sp. NBC_00589]WTI41097.1 NlpC/P60 family protein [Streptomyces sp. NBC_00775]WUB25219.1 NlpC/P60 family protein [Streptomyces sp. NBC_00589]